MGGSGNVVFFRAAVGGVKGERTRRGEEDVYL